MRPVAGAPAQLGHWPRPGTILYSCPITPIPKREPMEDADLQLLTAKFDQLLQKLEQLKAENRLLRANEKSWREERAHLIEKNEMARHKVEAMILRLKALEQDT
ncbi:TIGR02449 family protein [Pseudomonas aeruginosa]|nr:TIGR02449 family protein [Pseudomonas aeruginosa]